MYCDWPLLGRCCFCLPLRRGVLTFAYINIVYSTIMIGLYSYSIHHSESLETDFFSYREIVSLAAEVVIAMYCFEIIFDVVLLYGTHMKSVLHLKIYYYFALTTMAAVVLLQVIDLVKSPAILPYMIELLTIFFAGLCSQIYLVTLVRSLIKKLEMSGPHVYDNQLHQIVSGEIKIEPNGIYDNPTVVPAEV